MDKEEHRRHFWNDWASKADESGEHVRFMLGIDDIDEANFISEKDVAEVIGLLPDMSGMDVLELASGVGRFTSELAKQAKTVVSTDFTESFVEENKQRNAAKHPNITFKSLDATKLDYPPNSFDCIFFTWLMAYLNDNEIRKCAEAMLKIIRPGGFLFFRETHFTCACSCDTTGNAGDYRSIKEFRDLFKPARYSNEDGVQYRLEHIFSINSKTYTKYRKLPTLINYLWKKSKSSEVNDIQARVDKNYYDKDCMQIYDQVIGNGFTTPGGLEAAKKWISRLNLTSNSLILDIGCGAGGLQNLLIKEYDADVTSVDISMLACEATLLRLVKLQKDKGCVKIADVVTSTFPPDCFDFILVKETLEWFENYDNTLFQKFKKWLKPNGQLLIGGYFQTTSGNCSDANIFEKQVSSTGNIIAELEKSGFSQITSTDLSEDFIGYITTDLRKLEDEKKLSQEIKEKFSQLWLGMSTALESKKMQWMSLSAVKLVA